MAPSNKTMLFVCILVATVAVAQGTFIFGGGIPDLFTTTQITGVVFCTPNGTVTVGSGGVITSPPFPFALVQLRCGTGTGLTIANAITNTAGQFTITVNGVTYSTAQIVAGCRVVVTTPLARCNTTLSSNGTLTSNLQTAGSITLPPFFRINFVTPTGFTATP
ncbi:phylloplanin-like [Argentina anserina]|uniref:phylloplanin-like n=1 Tax=Argentina anserina TaxID=57926 RepID=UPI002176616F|nr:phylloplanin-like [Potentilla anserina]